MKKSSEIFISALWLDLIRLWTPRRTKMAANAASLTMEASKLSKPKKGYFASAVPSSGQSKGFGAEA